MRGVGWVGWVFVIESWSWGGGCSLGQPPVMAVVVAVVVVVVVVVVVPPTAQAAHRSPGRYPWPPPPSWRRSRGCGAATQLSRARLRSRVAASAVASMLAAAPQRGCHGWPCERRDGGRGEQGGRRATLRCRPAPPSPRLLRQRAPSSWPRNRSMLHHSQRTYWGGIF